MIKGLMKFITGTNDDPSTAPPAEIPQKGSGGLKDLENFVDYIVRSLVDNPQEVAITTANDAQGNVIQINCKKEDIGKIIGKRGKTIMAIRSLVNGAAGRLEEKITVEVMD